MSKRLPSILVCTLLVASCPSPEHSNGDDGGTPSYTVCGNNQRAGSEKCDGTDLVNESCSSQGFGPGNLGCLVNCSDFDRSTCAPGQACHNGQRDSVETCDGLDLGDATCESLGYGAGTLLCTDNCGNYDVSQCGSPPGCGDNDRQGAELCDGDDLAGVTCAMRGFVSGPLACASDCLGFDESGCRGPECTSSASCQVGQYCHPQQHACVAGCDGNPRCPAGDECDLGNNRCRDKAELCNGQDDDLDGTSDEDFPLKNQPCDGDDADQCASGTWVCNAAQIGLDCSGDVNRVETCDGNDNDCDTQTDEDWPTRGQACDGSDSDTCANGTFQCNASHSGVECVGDGPVAEVCNGRDDNCDTLTDTFYAERTINLGSAANILAFEARPDGSITIVTNQQNDAGTIIWTGNFAEGVSQRATASETYGHADVAGGVVAAIPYEVGGVWWGTPGSMRKDALTAPWTFDTFDNSRGGLVNVVDQKPVVTEIAEGQNSGYPYNETVIERVIWRWTGSAFAGASVYQHAYMGGNIDRGGFTGRPGGGIIGLVFDEHSNNEPSGMAIYCKWMMFTGSSWSEGDAHTMCEPPAAPLLVGGSVYAITEDWGSWAPTLQVTTDGDSINEVTTTLTADEEWPELVVNASNRLLLVAHHKTNNVVRAHFVAGASGSPRTLQAAGPATEYYLVKAVGDELVFVVFERPDWSTIANSRLVRELVCP